MTSLRAGDVDGAAGTAGVAQRVRGEFLEMPELRVTLQQAQRLLGVAPDQCAAVLDALVDGGVLECGAGRTYALRRTQP